MEFDWLDSPFSLKALTPREIEESFEDPFGLRLLPDLGAGDARYFNLGRSAGDRGIFSVFWSDGKKYRVILARDMTAEETLFYDRKNSDLNG